ncbi:MAG: S26 family signal peptidase [Fusobacteriales bacterium]|jgi:type IV secretory pathway protease TraF|nr:S26 family signal peptidase [Fusobacteriales bacterium]
MMMRRRTIIIYVTVILSIIILSPYLVVNIQPSLPIGIYLRIPAKKVKKNDIVIFDLDDKYDKYYKVRKIRYPMKRIVADYNDRVKIKRNRIFVNEESYGEILPLDMERPSLKIDKGCYYTLSKQINSFDSRYYGQVCQKEILYKAYFLIPLF